MLTITDLKKKFGKKEVLKGINLTLENKVYGLLGPNGSGKTTLLRCLTDNYKTDDGEILFDGVNTKKDKSYLSYVGYLPQKFGMYKELTPIEMMTLLSNLKGVVPEKIDVQSRELIELVGLTEKINDKIKTLSGGMIRRMGIAQSLIGSPRLLILDEPTAGLDPEERLRFKNIISEMKKDCTTIISTHIVSDVESICEQIIVLNEGEILFTGDASELKNVAKGKVFILDEVEAKPNEDCVVKRIFDDESGKKAVVLSSNPISNATPVEPDLEDGYLCTIKGI